MNEWGIEFGIILTTAQPDDYSAEDVFEQTLAQVHEAERLGFDNVWILEHHFWMGLCGDSMACAAFLLGETDNIAIGTAVTVAPLVHPVQLAERVNLISQLSKGRLRVGMGRGSFPKEYEVLGIDMGRNHEMMYEAVRLIVSSWDPPLKGSGPHYPFHEITVFPPPWGGSVPIYIAGTSPETVEFAGSLGLPMLLEQVEMERRRAIVDLHADVAMSSGYDLEAHPPDHALWCMANVADTQKEAEDPVMERFAWYQQQVDRTRKQLPIDKERRYANYEFHYRNAEDRVLRGTASTDSRLEGVKRLDPIGTPDVCIHHLQNYVDTLGVQHFMCSFEGAGGTPEVLESMRRFAAEVGPMIQASGVRSS